MREPSTSTWAYPQEMFMVSSGALSSSVAHSSNFRPHNFAPSRVGRKCRGFEELSISSPTHPAACVSSGSIPPDAAWLLRFKTHAEQCGYNTHTVAMNLSALREFLSYLRERDMTAEAAQLSDVASF